MAYAKITLIGAMEYFDNLHMSLFDYLNLPEGLDKEILIDDIVYRACDFELLHINPEYTRYAIGAFSNKWADTWQHWYDVLNMEYNPLYNYDRYEIGTDKHTGTQGTIGSNGYTKGNTGTQTIANTGTQSKANTGYTESHDTGTQTVDNTGTQTVDNTGTQTTLNTGTETTNHTGTTGNVEHNRQDYHDTATHTGTDDMHVVFGKTVDHNFTETTETVNEVSGFNSSSFVDHDRSTATTTHPTDHTVEGGTEDHNETKNLTDSDTGYVEEDNSNTRTDNLQDQRTDNLTATRTDDLTQERTDNLTQERTDNLTSRRTDDLNELRTDNLNQLRTDALSESLTGNDSSTRTDNLKDEHDAHLYGNIGVTTSQQMLQAELDVRKWNIYEKIADMFISEFCIMIY